MNIRFYGGVNEIGGNKILLEGPSSLFLDFGMSFSKIGQFYSEFLQPRKANGILDFIEFGLLPNLKGIYREDYLKHCGLDCKENPAIQGVLLSHAHMDHASYIHHLREDIPLYLTEESHLILKALEETGRTSFQDILTFKREYHLSPKKGGQGFKKLSGKDAHIKRNIELVNPYQKFALDEYQVQCIPVDHSLPGAAAYIIEGDDETIIYTGDLRFHGHKPELTQKFVKIAQKSQPTILLSEGTRIDSNKNITEADVERIVLEKCYPHKGLIVVNFPVRDLDRLTTFYRVAQATDRTLVVNLKQAYLLNLFQGKGYPELSDVGVYRPRKGWGLGNEDFYACVEGEWIASNQIDSESLPSEYLPWEREFLENDNCIDYQDLQLEPEKYIFRCDFFEFKELIDIKPKNGIYIRSVTEPFDEEMQFDFKRVQNWLKHFNLPIHQIHASGHASGPEILQMIRDINPEQIQPIHTLHPQHFQELSHDGIKVNLPVLDKK